MDGDRDQGDLQSKDRPGNGDEGAVDLRNPVRGFDEVAGCQEGDFRAGRDITIGGSGDEGWEGLKRRLC